MKTPLRFRGGLLLGLFVSCVSSAPLVFGADARQLWTVKLSGDAKWHQLTGLGTLLVGTDDALTCINPESGEVLWKNAALTKTTPVNVKEIAGTPILIANDAHGMMGSKSNLFAIDYLTGKELWRAPELTGQYVGTVAVPSHGLALLIFNGVDDKGAAATTLRAFDIATGEVKWLTNYAKSGAIHLHIADGSGKFIPTMDLSGYYDPVVEGDEIYLPYLGVHCVDLKTGALKWGVEFPAGNAGLKKTYAPLRLAGDRIYGAGGGSVFAIERATGKTLWKSERISAYAGLLKARNNALVSQIEIVGDKIFARFGGNFSNGQNVALMDPLGIVVLRASDGEAVYNVDSPKEGLTNLMVLPEVNAVMFADAANLYGLDVTAEKPTAAFKVPIEFKRKMGGGEVAQLGLGALGGLTGLAKAAIAQDKARLDVPISIARMDGHIVVMGKQHLLGFDPKAKRQKWSLYYAAPSDALGMTALFAVTAFAGLAGNGMAMQGALGSAQYNSGANLVHSSLDSYNKAAAQRKTATQGTDRYAYVLTKVAKGKDVGIVGVNLTTGEPDRELALGTKEPDYQADENAGRIFFFKGKDSVVAYQF